MMGGKLQLIADNTGFSNTEGKRMC